MCRARQPPNRPYSAYSVSRTVSFLDRLDLEDVPSLVGGTCVHTVHILSANGLSVTVAS